MAGDLSFYLGVDVTFIQWLFSLIRNPFRQPSFEAADDETSEEDRPPPLLSNPPDTRDNLFALAFKREHGRLEFKPIWTSKYPSKREQADLARQYGEYTEEYIHICVIGLFRTSNGAHHMLVQTSKPVDLRKKPFTLQEIQDLALYCFNVMKGEQGDAFMVSLEDMGLQKTCFLLSAAATGNQWSMRPAKKTIDGFQVDTPRAFTTLPEEAERDALRQIPVKVKFGGYAGFVEPEVLVASILRGEDIAQAGLLTIGVPPKSILTRIYSHAYQAKRESVLTVFEFNTRKVYTYSQRGTLKKVSSAEEGLPIHETDSRGVPYIGEWYYMSRHMGDPTVGRFKTIPPQDMEPTPPPVRRRSTPPPD
jgi:hypothetical protein